MARPCTDDVKLLLDDWGPTSRMAICDLYTFYLIGGEILRYSGWQKALSVPAPQTNSPLIDFPLGAKLKRNKTKFQIGVQVDEMDIEIYAADETIVTNGGTITWQEALHKGLFDGAYLDMWRCFMSPPGIPIGTITWFYGRVADVDVGRTKSVIKVRSLLDLLSQQMPRRLFQAACTHIFGDAMCLFDRTTMAQDITATGGTLQSQINFSGFAPSPSTLYDQGTITGKTGANTGYKRTITHLKSGIVYILDPWVFTVNIGDEFTLLPGCDHTLETCTNTFNNAEHFGGFPYIPPPDNAV
jgi:uncharacterized phage protein (TIGR02218 family)